MNKLNNHTESSNHLKHTIALKYNHDPVDISLNKPDPKNNDLNLPIISTDNLNQNKPLHLVANISNEDLPMQSVSNLHKNLTLKWVDASAFNQVKNARGSKHHVYGIHYLNSFNVGVMTTMPTLDNFPEDFDVVIYKNAVYYINSYPQKIQKLNPRSLVDEPPKFPQDINPNSIKKYLDSIFYTRLLGIGMSKAKKQLFGLSLVKFIKCPPLPSLREVFNTVTEAEKCAYEHFIKYHIE